MTLQQLVSILCKEYKQCKERADGNDIDYLSKVPNGASNQKKKKRPCGICRYMNHVTADCQNKGKIKCSLCGKFGHTEKECWRNPENKGKGCMTKSGQTNEKGGCKGNERAKVGKEPTSTDEEDKANKAYVTHVPMDENDKVDFSTYPWIADSATTSHICTQCDAFIDYRPIPSKEITGLGDKVTTAYSRGMVVIDSRVEDRSLCLCLPNMLYVPEACENLISLGHINAVGGQAMCSNNKMEIQDVSHCVIARGECRDHLYYLNATTRVPTEQVDLSVKIKSTYTWEEWHCCLEHISVSGLKWLHGKNLVDGFSIADSPQDFDCKACIEAKQSRSPIPKEVSRWDRLPSELTHTDFWGPAQTSSLKGYRYYISFIDDAS